MAQRYKFSIESKSFPLDISGEPIDGIVYVNVDDNGYWKVAVANDMKAVGFNIDLNKVF